MKKYISLIEIIVVCALVSILSAFIFSHANGMRMEGKRIDCLNNMKQIQLKMEAHKLKTGKWCAITETCVHTGHEYYLNQDHDRIEEADGGHENVVYLHSSKNNKGGIATTVDKSLEESGSADAGTSGDTSGEDTATTTDTSGDDGKKDKSTKGNGETKDNNGHGNNVDGVDSSNKGKSKQGEDSDPNVDDEK